MAVVPEGIELVGYYVFGQEECLVTVDTSHACSKHVVVQDLQGQMPTRLGGCDLVSHDLYG